ncbi:hypothetical protein GCM10010207_66710 [Streptomyces atratus]|nr:hypothetical protein GCM10010207_66710 [Streptomyces atratus]
MAPGERVRAAVGPLLLGVGVTCCVERGKASPKAVVVFGGQKQADGSTSRQSAVEGVLVTLRPRAEP